MGREADIARVDIDFMPKHRPANRRVVAEIGRLPTGNS
jgi:hypothetical protein